MLDPQAVKQALIQILDQGFVFGGSGNPLFSYSGACGDSASLKSAFSQWLNCASS
jgi:hypothetical protein